MAVTVREATLDDAAALVAYLRRLDAEPTGTRNGPHEADEVEYSVEQELVRLDQLFAAPGILLLAEHEGELIGEITLHAISKLRALRHVATLGISVRADWRGLGVGKLLMARGLEWTARAGITRVELQVYARNTVAIHLYERFGFEHEGRRRRMIREGDGYVDDLLMARLS